MIVNLQKCQEEIRRRVMMHACVTMKQTSLEVQASIEE